MHNYMLYSVLYGQQKKMSYNHFPAIYYAKILHISTKLFLYDHQDAIDNI